MKDAVELVDAVSAREVDRAIKAGHTPHKLKNDGKDARARMVRVSHLRVYRDLRDAIPEVREQAPGGWPASGGRS